ncbi:hypothetical protein CYMTET_49881 [Cymbomonas tetramitiformis]|uniref:Uncharacterized protein n=1 Tax=Cymbomonas tetramitiformis TaxID=36881 RepID=A0AAE0BPA4_9CHLO|nr:hypothetical protein CYMTET_49881 [Cymbomonas tetramitiformis]
MGLRNFFDINSTSKKRQSDASSGSEPRKKTKIDNKRKAFRGPGMPTDNIEKAEGALTALVTTNVQKNGVVVAPLYQLESERSKPRSSNLRKSILKYMHDVTLGLDRKKGKCAVLNLY